MSTQNLVPDLSACRPDFPVLSREVHGKPLVYFDNAATSQKPRCVLEAVQDCWGRYNANVHRAIHTLGEEATEEYETARDKVAAFLHAPQRQSIIFTREAVEIADGQIRNIRFGGGGCAIFTASTSMMTEAVKGRTLPETEALIGKFLRMMRGEEPDEVEELGDLEALRGVVQFPVRVKCATLGWHALECGLEQYRPAG